MAGRVLEKGMFTLGLADMKSEVLSHTEKGLSELPVLKFTRTPV